MQVTANVGPITKLADGAQPMLNMDQQGGLKVSEIHGQKSEQALRQNLFHIANQAAVTTTAALATTWTGLAISNPAGSGVNAFIRTFSCAQFAVGAASAIGIMSGAGAAAGSLVPRPSNVLAATGKVTASAGATIATPVLDVVLGQVGSLATTGYGLTPGLVWDFQNGLMLPPGSFAASFTSIITTSALLFGFEWEEVPI